MISKNKKKKIAYVTGTRADFGLMTPVLNAIQQSKSLDLTLYATGEHLKAELGNTINEVRKYFPKVLPIRAILKGDTKSGVTKFAGDFLLKVSEVLNQNRPDLIIVLGDRIEMLGTALACLYLGIPVAHIHGGEKTGTVDEVARHAITKLSQLHFAATKDAAERIIKMGEVKKRVYTVGAPALDTILNESLPTKVELYARLKLDLGSKFILLVQHPVSEDIENAGKQMAITIKAVKHFKLPVVVVYPHLDVGGQKIIKEIEKEKSNKLFKILKNVDHKTFLALEREALVMVGNSSAGIIEVASFQTPVINIGDRQKNRERSGNVLDVGYNEKEIILAIKKSLNDKKYLAKLKKIKNIYGDGKTSKRIVKILENLKIDKNLLNKHIYY